MPHVAFVPLTGLRVRAEQLLELGMSLPGFEPRRQALAELPALGVLTLAGMMPPDWTCSYHEAHHDLDSDPWLELADDNTFAGTRDPEPLLSALGASGARYFTEADWRIGERPNLLGQIAAIGCVQILVGIESLVFRYPGMGGKVAEPGRILDSVAAIQEQGIVVNGGFILGAEGETNESLDRLSEFILASNLAEVQLTIQTPFPGTSLREKLLRAGRLLEDRVWSHYTLLYLLLFGIARVPRESWSSFWGRYRSFLGLYWMTAPLAWLYAIPVEQFLSPVDAVRINLCLLLVVSVWRVALMTRVVGVLFRCHPMAAFFSVMLFADLVAMAVFWLTRLPILSIMGGIRLTESESVVQGTGFLVRFLGTVSLPIWMIAALVVISRRRIGDTWKQIELPADTRSAVSVPLCLVAGLGLVVWLFVLPLTQPQQVNRRTVEQLLRANQIDEALEYMSDRPRNAFPPHWDPPPRPGYGEEVPSVEKVLARCHQLKAPGWVRDMFLDKARLQDNPDAAQTRRRRPGQLRRVAQFTAGRTNDCPASLTGDRVDAGLRQKE